MSGWRSPKNSEDESKVIDPTPEEEVDLVDSGKIVSGLQADQEKVLAVVKNNDIDEGADITSDFDHLGLSKVKLREILNWLSDEGYIYSTIDEDHFKAIERVAGIRTIGINTKKLKK